MQETPKPTEQFEYDQICKSDSRAKMGPRQIIYRSKIEESSVFVYLQKLNVSPIEPIWKIHVSLLENTENIRLAWNLIKDVLIKYEIDTTKVLRKDCYFPEFQLGKEITIYDQPTKFNWEKILNEITELLNNNSIKPGFLPINDQPIKGSNFLSFRCDVDENNKKVSSLQAKSYKPPQFSHDLENITIDADISKNQPSKPQRANENRIKEFYGLLERELLNFEKNIFTLLPATPLRDENCIIGDRVFYQQVTKNYLDTKLTSEDDFARLKDSINIYEKITHEFNYHNFNIANADRETYLKIFAEYERKFSNIEKILRSIENNIQNAQETLSNTGSVVEKGSTPGSPSPPLPGSPKGYAQIQQALAVHRVPTVVSGQDRMLVEIEKALNIDLLEIDEKLNKSELTGEHIKNIYNIIKSGENICDVIVAGFKNNSLTLDQVKNITPELLTRLSTDFARELHSRTLTTQAILEKLETFKRESEISSHAATSEMSSSASLKSSGHKNP